MLENIRKQLNLLNRKESETVLISIFLLKEQSIRKRKNELESLRLHNMKEKKQKFGPLSLVLPRHAHDGCYVIEY